MPSFTESLEKVLHTALTLANEPLATNSRTAAAFSLLMEIDKRSVLAIGNTPYYVNDTVL